MTDDLDAVRGEVAAIAAEILSDEDWRHHLPGVAKALLHQRAAGLRDIATLADALQHPTLKEPPVGGPREKFYQTHIRGAWRQAGHWLANQARTLAAQLEAASIETDTDVSGGE